MEIATARLFTVRETALILRRSEFWVREQVKSGALKPVESLGKPYMFTEKVLDDFVNGASKAKVIEKKKQSEELTVPERSKKWHL